MKRKIKIKKMRKITIKLIYNCSQKLQIDIEYYVNIYMVNEYHYNSRIFIKIYLIRNLFIFLKTAFT